MDIGSDKESFAYHKKLSKRYQTYAEERIESGRAASTQIWDVAGTEWPVEVGGCAGCGEAKRITMEALSWLKTGCNTGLPVRVVGLVCTDREARVTFCVDVSTVTPKKLTRYFYNFLTHSFRFQRIVTRFAGSK